MPDRFELQINIQIRPIQMVAVKKLEMIDLGHGRVLEPWKIRERQKIFRAVDIDPKAMGRNVNDLSF